MTALVFHTNNDPSPGLSEKLQDQVQGLVTCSFLLCDVRERHVLAINCRQEYGQRVLNSQRKLVGR